MRRLISLVLLCSLLIVSTSASRVAPPRSGPPPKSKRQERLEKLTYDRRPSAILKTWAPAPPKEPEDKAKGKGKGKAQAKPAKPDPLDVEMTALQRNVTLGKWDAVKAYFAGVTEDEGKAGYAQMLRSLQSSGPMMMPGGGPDANPEMMMMMRAMGGNLQQWAERNRYSPDDIVGLAAAAPKGLEKEHIDSLGSLMQQCLHGGTVIEAAVARLKVETAKPKGALTARQAARILLRAGQPADTGDFLPTLAKAQADKDLEALNLLAQFFIGRHGRDSKHVHLEEAWTATQSALALPPVPENRVEQLEALRRAVELAPKLKDELGLGWLEQSFTTKPQRGMTILATIGTLSAQGLTRQPFNPDERAKTLKLQKTAVEALLKASPARAKEWRDTVSLLAHCWLKEAEFSYTYASTRQARLRRDRFGNYYFWDEETPWNRQMMMGQQNMPRPIETEPMLLARPEKLWLEQVYDDLRPKLAMTLCQLHLKTDEETKAFPFIEQLASTHPRKARELANEFLQVWTRNHDPNSNRRRTSYYMFMFGFDQRADGIPLTRSKQERNLDDLAGWVTRLRKLPLGEEVDQDLLARAFTACHSSAEVYRSEAIEKVFGPIGGLKPKTLSGLAQQMRENLAGIWRKPEEQKDKKTNRKTKDIQSEVMRGYAVALATVENALKKFPDDWSLVLARAAILHDEAGFHQELQKDTSFAPKRSAAYAEFARAAKLYAARVKELPEEEQSTKVYDQWFYASLGACDLGAVTEEKVPDLSQPAKVRQALLALPGETLEKHREKFATQLFTRMSAVKPQIKFRYVKAGFEILGDHPQADEAKKVYDYYKDLVSEIKLEAQIDGSSVVGHKRPFGVYVFLRHTRDIERESGGFGRYLQNQNTSAAFSWNYGRPTADYRDRFQTAATEALKEHFEVVSVTFETDKVHSRAAKEYGWRITPYAYLLLKPRGPQVDKLPPLRMDLDFLDTSGSVVLPIETPAVPLDARPEKGEPRPARKLKVTQTLDERQADKGKLLLEIKATAQGLVPELEAIADVGSEGFEVVRTDDQGVSVTRFEEEADTITVSSERTWMVTLKAREDAASKPETFRFPAAKAKETEVVFQRFNDADMVPAEAEITLEADYGKRRLHWGWWVGLGVGLTGVAAALAVLLLRKPKARAGARWTMPAPLTPFTTIGLLERIHRDGKLTEEQREQVQASIRQVERSYFAGNGEGPADLRAIAEGWIQRAG
jgi:hypothetical protein